MSARKKVRFVNLEAGYAMNGKTLAIGAEGVALDVGAMCYTRTNRTDGFIPSSALRALYPPLRKPEKVAAVLVAHERWQVVEGGWVIVGWLERNPSEAQLSARGKAGAEARWDADRMQDACDSDATGNAKRMQTDADVDVDVDVDVENQSSSLTLVPPEPDDDDLAIARRAKAKEQLVERLEAGERKNLGHIADHDLWLAGAYERLVVNDWRPEEPKPRREPCDICHDSGWVGATEIGSDPIRCECMNRRTA